MREPEGFSDFVVSHQAALQRTAFLLTGDWQLAEDLVQATLAKAWGHWARVIRAGQPDAYVRRMIVTTYVTWWRRRWRREFTADAFLDIPAPADQVAETTDRLVARGAPGPAPGPATGGARAPLLRRHDRERGSRHDGMHGRDGEEPDRQGPRQTPRRRGLARLAGPGQAEADAGPGQAEANAGPGRTR